MEFCLSVIWLIYIKLYKEEEKKVLAKVQAKYGLSGTHLYWHFSGHFPLFYCAAFQILLF